MQRLDAFLREHAPLLSESTLKTQRCVTSSTEKLPLRWRRVWYLNLCPFLVVPLRFQYRLLLKT